MFLSCEDCHNITSQLEYTKYTQSEYTMGPRNNVKGWLLTYPQNDAPKEELLQKLIDLGAIEAVVCEEKHEDGSPHLHAFAKFDPGFKCNDAPRIFNLLEKTGSYEPARSWKACAEYVQKDGNYVTHNLDIESAQQKKSKRNRELIERPISELVEDGTISILQAPQLKKAKLVYEECKNNTFNVDPTQKRGLWIYGPPGVGKSYKARTEYPDLYIKSQNKWWDGYTGQKNVLIDDFDKQGSCLSHYIKIWSDVYQTTGEVKGGTVNLNYNKLIITSNYHPSEIFEEDNILLAAITRRFEIINIDKPLEFINQPLNPLSPNYYIKNT